MNGTLYPPCFISGYYCDQEGQTDVTGPCAPGFYCLTGSDNDSPLICPEGRYCPEGENNNKILCLFLSPSLNSGHAGPRYAPPLQTVYIQISWLLNLHCLSFSI